MKKNSLPCILLSVICTFSTQLFAEKPRLAISEIVANPAVIEEASQNDTLNTLNQILQATDSLLATTINQTSRFDLVARSKYRAILNEQKIADSGDVDLSDPQRAKAFLMAGAKYVATVTVDNYEEITDSLRLEGGYGGGSSAEARTITIQATLQIFDTTTGVMGPSATIALSDREATEKLVGSTRKGTGTHVVIGRISKEFALKAANAIMDMLVPAKVIGYTVGNITFTRGEGTGVEVGQIWQVFHPGEEMFDPDTGESFGAEEIAIGWAKVTSVHPKFSKASAIQDHGINKGNLIREAPEGLPDDIDPNARPKGSAFSSGGGSTPSAPSQPNSNRQSNSVNDSPSKNEVGDNESSNQDAVKLAIFVRNVTADVPDEKVMVLEAFITSWLTDKNISVISRAEVLNAVSNFAAEGANSGTGSPLEVEELLSDQTSALALARNLGADGLVVATITSYIVDKREIRDSRGNYDNIFYTLDIAWNVLDGGTGGSVASGIAKAKDGIKQYENQTRSFDIDTLLRKDAEEIGAEIRIAMANPETRIPSVEATLIPVRINIALSDLSIPELIKQENGEYLVGANRYQLEPMACNVFVDGMLQGTAPGIVPMSPGPHQITIRRPMLEPSQQFMVVRPDMPIFTIPVALSAEGRRQWKEQALFFESLKSNAVMREAELEKAKGLAEFLRNSNLTIDTSALKKIETGSSSFWEIILEQ